MEHACTASRTSLNEGTSMQAQANAKAPERTVPRQCLVLWSAKQSGNQRAQYLVCAWTSDFCVSKTKLNAETLWRPGCPCSERMTWRSSCLQLLHGPGQLPVRFRHSNQLLSNPMLSNQLQVRTQQQAWTGCAQPSAIEVPAAIEGPCHLR